MEQHLQRDRIDEKSRALSEFSKFCALLSSENRLKIVLETAEQERSVGEISDLVGLSQSATSQHLKILRDASVLSCRREKQNSLYSVTSEKIKRMLSCI